MKLKEILKESKYLKREFGEALPTLDSVMKQHQEESKKSVNEGNVQRVKTRFGILEIKHEEVETAPGFSPLYIVVVFLNKKQLKIIITCKSRHADTCCCCCHVPRWLPCRLHSPLATARSHRTGPGTLATAPAHPGMRLLPSSSLASYCQAAMRPTSTS